MRQCHMKYNLTNSNFKPFQTDLDNFFIIVTRNSLRRMASNESLTDLEARSATPTLKLRGKALDTIGEHGK